MNFIGSAVAAWDPAARQRRVVVWAATAVYLAVLVGPFLVLVAGLPGGWSPAAPLLPDRRLLGLLGNSLLVAAGSATLGVLGGWGTTLLTAGTRLAGLVRVALTVLLFVPPYLHTLGWMSLSDVLRSRLGGGVPFPQGLAWTTIVLGTAFAPLAALVAWQALAGLGRSAGEAVVLAAPPGRAWGRVLWPAWRGPLLDSWLVIFWLTLADYGVPMQFQLPVLATELVSSFVGGASPAAVLAVSWPLTLLTALAGGLALVRLARRWTATPGGRSAVGTALFDPARWPAAWTGGLALAASLLVLGAGLPCLGLGLGAAGPWTGPGVGAAWPALAVSLTVGLLAAGLATVVVVPLGDRLAAGLPAAAALPLALPLLFPALLLGFSHALTWTTPWLSWAHAHGAGLLAAHLGRILPFCLALAVLWRRGAGAPPGEDAALVFAGGGWLRARLDLPRRVGILLLGLLLSLRELDVSLLTVPPGRETLPLRLFNLMHYGAGSEVARLGLLLALAVGLAAALLRRVADLLPERAADLARLPRPESTRG